MALTGTRSSMQLLERREPPPALTYSLGSVRTIIFDTASIVNHVAERVRGGLGYRIAGPSFGRARSFAAEQVLDDLYACARPDQGDAWDGLAERSRREGWATAPEVFRRVFETEYLDDLVFVDVKGLFDDDPLVADMRVHGTIAAATARLAVLLSRTHPLVYAEDRPLYELAMTPQPHHFQAVMAAGTKLAPTDPSGPGVTYVGAGLLWAADGSPRSAAGVLRIPAWVARAGAAGGAAWSHLGSERRSKIAGVLTPVGRFLEQELEQAVGGLARRATPGFSAATEGRLECRIGEVLARRTDEDRQTAAQIQQEVAGRAESSDVVPSLTEVAAALHSRPCFVEGPRRRYRLGSTFEAAASA